MFDILRPDYTWEWRYNLSMYRWYLMHWINDGVVDLTTGQVGYWESYGWINDEVFEAAWDVLAAVRMFLEREFTSV